MALTNCRTNGLGRLPSRAILNDDILIWARPSVLLIATGFEHTLISEDEMMTSRKNLIHAVS